MDFATSSQRILRNLLMNRLRTFLSIFCISWGTFTVSILFALGDGFRAQTQSVLSKITENSFLVVPGVTSENYLGYSKGRKVKFNSNIVVNLPQVLHQIQYITPFLLTSADVGSYDHKMLVSVVGVGSDLVKIRQIHIEDNGRFINNFDIQDARRVAVVGSGIKNSLLGYKEALGEIIKIRDFNFKIVGEISRSLTLPFPAFYDRRILIPYSTYSKIFGQSEVNFFLATYDQKYNISDVEKSLRNYFGRLFNFDPNDISSLRIFDSATMFNFFKWFFLAIKIFLAFCGGITIGVGSVGVANIMFFSVVERTKEIGLRMALGATYDQILEQIIWEGLFIIIFGGIIGFLISYLAIRILGLVNLPEWIGKPEFSLNSILISIFILGVFGLFASFFPARKAALLDPIEALNS